MTRLQINGQTKDVEGPDDIPLLWALRDELGMTGTKFGCGMAMCGACTVHMDGAAIRSCVTPVSAVAGRAISTIEGMEADRVGQVVQQAWIENNVAQCGYCQAGQIMTAVSLLRSTPKASVGDAVSKLHKLLPESEWWALVSAHRSLPAWMAKAICARSNCT